MLPKRWPLILLLLPLLLPAQERSDFQQILQRLDQLERENRNLADEVHALRAEIAVARPPAASAVVAEAPSVAAGAPVNVSPVPIEERVSVQEQRTEELSQTKVQAAQRMPVTLTGMVLFNAFLNGSASGGAQDPLVAALSDSVSGGGASLSQSIIGLRFQGPARPRRGPGEGIARHGLVGRHGEFSQSPGADARRHHSSRLEKQQRDGGPGQALDCAARSGFAGAGGFLAP